MNAKLLIGLSVILFTFLSCNGQTGEKETEVMLETTVGNIRIKLYNDTPLHRDNFIRNVRDGKYDGVTWHRIIRNFMIQTGEQPVQFAENGDTIKADPSEWIPSEIVYPKYYHKRGMVASAREIQYNKSNTDPTLPIMGGQAYGTILRHEAHPLRQGRQR